MNILAYVHLRNIHRSTGAGRVARELIEHVSREDAVNLHILADQTDHATVVPKVGQPWAGFPYHLFSSSTSIQQAKWLMLRHPLAETFWPESEIVHCTGESYVPTKASRLVVTVHDAAYFDAGAHRRSFSTFKQEWKWRVLFQTLLRRADAFHTVSHFSAERLAAAFPEMRSRLRVIYNGVSSFFFEPACQSEDRRILRSMGLADSRYVLFPCGLQYRKNPEMVLNSWPIVRQRIPDLVLAIAGHCHPEYAAGAAALGKSVVFTGFVEDPQLRALYRGAHAVWYPSRYEGFGLPVVEAMACGTPVVTSDRSSLPEIAGDAAILVNPGSVDENVAAIETVVNDSRVRSGLEDRGRRRAQRFTWPAAASELHALYSSLL